MRIAERLKILARDEGTGERQIITKLADICGIKYQAVHQWFVSSNPAPENLAAIAKYYGANLMWVITGEGNKLDTDRLDDDEIELISAWRTLREESQQLVLTQFRALSEAQSRSAKSLE